MPRDLLHRLEEWKGRFGTSDSRGLERLLRQVAKHRFKDAGSLVRLHETLLFLRAYPCTAEVARLTDAILYGFAERVRGLRKNNSDLAAFESPEVSGIAGTSFSAVFSYEVARRLAARYPRSLDIDWDGYESNRLGPVMRRFLPLLEEDWSVEAHVPYLDWIRSARPRGETDLGWLLERLAALPVTESERAELYESLELPLLWRIEDAPASRSRLRLPRREIFYHQQPLLARRDVSLERELKGPPFPLTRLARREARGMLDLILDTSAMRYRELWGFTYPDAKRVYRVDLGRGVEVFLFGVPPRWRLPLRAYHGGAYFKNGVPAGYLEVLSLFERAEVGFNLYYTFREGESAWLYARLLHLLRQTLGVTCFSVDPYQLGHENQEGIASGAFWFYRKLGFRPVEPAIARLVEREERRIGQGPGYRSSSATLEKLAAGYALYECGGDGQGAWDRFRVRNLGLAVQLAMAERFRGDPEKMRRAAREYVRKAIGVDTLNPLTLVLTLIPNLGGWSEKDKAGVAAVLRAKEGNDEARYLRLMQRHLRLRAAFLEIGSSTP